MLGCLQVGQRHVSRLHTRVSISLCYQSIAATKSLLTGWARLFPKAQRILVLYEQVPRIARWWPPATHDIAIANVTVTLDGQVLAPESQPDANGTWRQVALLAMANLHDQSRSEQY